MNSKPVKLRLKIDLVSYPAREEGVVNIYNIFNSPELLKTQSPGSYVKLSGSQIFNPYVHLA